MNNRRNRRGRVPAAVFRWRLPHTIEAVSRHSVTVAVRDRGEHPLAIKVADTGADWRPGAAARGIRCIRHGRPAPARLPAGIASVLSVLSSSAVVLDSDDRVLRASAAARAFGLVKGDRLMVGELVALARQVRRDGEIREGEIEVPGPGSAAGRPASRSGWRRSGAGVGGGGLVLLLAEDQTESRRVEEVRRDFVANISHELKTPVGALALLAETVEDAADDPEAVRRFAGRMRQEASRLTNLVQDLITLSRIQAAEPIPDPSPVDLDMVVAEALDRCRMKASARGIELDVDRGPRPVRAGRRGPAGHRAAQPAGERGRLQPGADPGGRSAPSRSRRPRRDQRRRPGHRHPRAGPGADLRAVLPGRPGPLPGHRRDRPGAGHRQARDGGARRPGDGVEQGGRGVDVHPAVAAANATDCGPDAQPPAATAREASSDPGAGRRRRGIVQRRAVLHAAQGGLRGSGLPDRAGRARHLRPERRRPGAARPHAARAAGQRGVPDAARAVERAGHHADRQGQRDRQGGRAWNWAPTTT